NIHDVAKAASNGSLRGARGNSGVILSQLFRGFARGLEGKATATGEDFAAALAQSVETAYAAIMKPKEGTILTIARSIFDRASEYGDGDIRAGMESIIRHAEEVLELTPTMLPELKQAGVVDAGGMGLIMIYKGALEAFTLTEEPVPLELSKQRQEPVAYDAAYRGVEIKFMYCTEALIDLKKEKANEAEASFKFFLEPLGDSIVVAADDGIMKIHVHTNHPGKVLEKAVSLGELSNVKIDNMRLQHTSQIIFSTEDKPRKQVGFVAVASGGGLVELFKGLGADLVIEGGQTMNPSAEEIARAVSAVNADDVIVLPNNKNIIAAAKQAAEIDSSGKNVHVLPTRSIPQGVSCLVNFVDSVSAEENIGGMKAAMECVHTGQITRAVRETVLDERQIRENDILAIYDGKIVFIRNNVQQAAKDLSDHMLSFGGDVVSVYYGESVTEEMASEISAHVIENFPESEVEAYCGMQPVYDYILSVE
ncbi:MAG: DAK2 domain-containing protein, partial [Defluviitaleaceae bacterium]|nr:DAK2 domain-containing protein [Defluviitaleaceae bacterium]